jgi:hypothetical protein
VDLQALAAEPYEARGILHSEVALIIEACRSLGIKRFIESGRARGQSTYMLAKYMPDVEVHSVEGRMTQDEHFARARLAMLDNVKLYMGDGEMLLPMIASESVAPTAVFCDGPKGVKAVKVVRECFSLPQVMLGFIHDMRKLDHTLPSPHRDCAITHLPYHEFSDDPRLVERLSWLDAVIPESEVTRGPAHLEKHGSYGPTIGAFLNPQSIKQSVRDQIYV